MSGSHRRSPRRRPERETGAIRQVGYKVAVGDLELADACELLGVLTAGAESPPAGRVPSRSGVGRSRYGDMAMARPDVLAARESKGQSDEHDR
jgi:hypothetical protein